MGFATQFTVRRLLLVVAIIAAILGVHSWHQRELMREKKIEEAQKAADFLRNGYFTRTGYVGLYRSHFSESDLQSKASKRLHKLANDSALADYLVVADYIENNPLDYAGYYNRAYDRREEGYRHAVAFRRLAIHSPAQRRKSRIEYCKRTDIRKAGYDQALIRMLEISDRQLEELDGIKKTYDNMDRTSSEKSKWIRKARWEVFTPKQHAVWNRMVEEDGEAPDPPNLRESEIATESELERLSPVFKAVRNHASLNLSNEQQESLAAFSEIVRTSIRWIEQFEYPKSYFPNDPSFAERAPMAKTLKEAMFHADQYLLLKILTPEQYDQLVPEIVGERDEFPLKHP